MWCVVLAQLAGKLWLVHGTARVDGILYSVTAGLAQDVTSYYVAMRNTT